MKFTKIPINTFETLGMNAGVLLDSFDPDTPTTDFDEHIIGATSGGMNFTAVPAFSDAGEDIDNCPKNTKELKRLDSWEVKASGTMVTMKKDTALLLTAAADTDTAKPNKIAPRRDLKDTDFKDIWIVGDYSDKNSDANGGFIAIHIISALSTGGFALQTTDKSKMKFAFEFTGHFSIAAQDVVPFELYIQAGTADT